MESCSPSALRFVVGEYAKILARHGDSFEDATLVTPTPEHFPDEFHRDAESVQTLLERVLSYTPLADDLTVRLGFVEGEGERKRGGGCGSSACGTGGGWTRVDGAIDEGDGYRALAHVMDTSSPVRLVGQLARTTGAILMAEAGEEMDEDIGAKSEIWAAASGLGVCLLNAAHVVSKACSGVSMHQGTALDASALSVMLALFCAVRGVKPSAARAHLHPTQREAFDHACGVVANNGALVRKLKETPELLEDGIFELEQPKGLFARIFSTKQKDADEAARAPTAATARSEEQRRRLAEARALVDEAFE